MAGPHPDTAALRRPLGVRHSGGGFHSQSVVCDMGGHLPVLSGVGKLRGWLWQLLLMTKSMAFEGRHLGRKSCWPKGEKPGTGEGRGVATPSVGLCFVDIQIPTS